MEVRSLTSFLAGHLPSASVLWNPPRQSPGYMPPRCSMPTAAAGAGVGGHGRDTCISAARIRWWPPILSDVAVAQLRRSAQARGMLRAGATDCARSAPASARQNRFRDGAFAHMALCYGVVRQRNSCGRYGEVGGVLGRSGKVRIYTVRHTGDAHYGAGRAHGDDIFECGVRSALLPP